MTSSHSIEPKAMAKTVARRSYAARTPRSSRSGHPALDSRTAVQESPEPAWLTHASTSPSVDLWSPVSVHYVGTPRKREGYTTVARLDQRLAKKARQQPGQQVAGELPSLPAQGDAPYEAANPANRSVVPPSLQLHACAGPAPVHPLPASGGSRLNPFRHLGLSGPDDPRAGAWWMSHAYRDRMEEETDGTLLPLPAGLGGGENGGSWGSRVQSSGEAGMTESMGGLGFGCYEDGTGGGRAASASSASGGYAPPAGGPSVSGGWAGAGTGAGTGAPAASLSSSSRPRGKGKVVQGKLLQARLDWGQRDAGPTACRFCGAPVDLRDSRDRSRHGGGRCSGRVAAAGAADGSAHGTAGSGGGLPAPKEGLLLWAGAGPSRGGGQLGDTRGSAARGLGAVSERGSWLPWPRPLEPHQQGPAVVAVVPGRHTVGSRGSPARQLLEHVTSVLGGYQGADSGPDSYHTRRLALVFIGEQGRALGCVVAEQVVWAHRALPATGATPAPASASSTAPTASKAGGGAAVEAAGALHVDTTARVSVEIGIAQVWVHGLARRQGVASLLLDATRRCWRHVGRQGVMQTGKDGARSPEASWNGSGGTDGRGGASSSSSSSASSASSGSGSSIAGQMDMGMVMGMGTGTGEVVPLAAVAFSHPTPAGAKLAVRYLGRADFPVYT